MVDPISLDWSPQTQTCNHKMSLNIKKEFDGIALYRIWLKYDNFWKESTELSYWQSLKHNLILKQKYSTGTENKTHLHNNWDLTKFT